MKILASFTYPHVIPDFFKDFLGQNNIGPHWLLLYGQSNIYCMDKTKIESIWKYWKYLKYKRK